MYCSILFYSMFYSKNMKFNQVTYNYSRTQCVYNIYLSKNIPK